MTTDRTAFFVPDPVVENLPDEATEPMSDRANDLHVPEARDEPAIHDGEDRTLDFHDSICGLVEDTSQLPVALRLAWR